MAHWNAPEEIRLPQFRALAAIAVLALAAALVLPQPATAQQSVGRIVASVNDDAITDFDVEARARLIGSSSGVTVTTESFGRLGRQALRELIDDRLKQQEAKRLGIAVSDQEIGAAVRSIERSNDMDEGGLMRKLTNDRVPIETLLDQIKASLLWRKVLRRVVLPQVTVAAEEVSEALDRIREAGGGAVVRAAEIFLPANSAEDFAAARRRAAEIASLATDARSFARLAAQYSRAPTAAVGGDLGQVQPGQLAPELETALAQLGPGQTSQPIERENGVYLVHLISRRQVERGVEDQAVVSLARAFAPVAQGEDAEAVGRALTNVVAGAEGCDAFERAVSRAYGQQPSRVVDARIGDLPEQIRAQIAALEPGGATAPVLLGDGVAMFMLCRRAEVGDGLPSAERVAESIQTQRAQRRADRYLRDLRRVAFIDIRG